MNARIVVLPLLLIAAGSRAQEVNLATIGDGARNRVYLRAGAEYGMVAGVGYARAVSLLDRTVLLGSDVTMPAAPDAGDWRVRATALVPLAGGDRWRLAGTFAPGLGTSSNQAGRMTALGVDLGAVGGYYAPGWFLGGELGFDWAITTHIANSEAYRRLVYANARDGWYTTPGGNLRAGLQAGLSLSRYDLVLRAGKLRDIKGEGPMLPIYGTLALDVRF